MEAKTKACAYVELRRKTMG